LRIALAIWCVCSVTTQGQEAPLTVGASAPILDEKGIPLHGIDPSAITLFGHEAPPGCLIQVLRGPTIYPPNADGTPHVSNALLHVTRVGRGVIPSPEQAGTFAASVSPRPSGTVFVRAFNGASVAQSTRIGNSQLFTVNGNDVFLADIPATDQAFAVDSDGDGLNDPWEDYFGSDSGNADSDGDGMADGDEYRAGTGLGDADSNLGVASVDRLSGGGCSVGWDSVPGRAYRVEYSADSLAGAQTYSDVGPLVTATGVFSQVQVTLPPGDRDGHFRVRLVE